MIRLSVPHFDEASVAEIAAVLRTGYLTQGPRVREFEARISEMIGSRHAFAMSSCTAALHLALVAAGIGPGDEVLVSKYATPLRLLYPPGHNFFEACRSKLDWASRLGGR